MRKLPLVVFLSLVVSALLASLGSCHLQARSIDNDVRLALSQTLQERPTYVVDADTIRVYRSYITVAEVRDTASISVKTVRRAGQDVAVLEANAGYSFLTLLSLSDQRPATVLMAVAVLWLVGCLWNRKTLSPTDRPLQEGGCYGGLFYAPKEGRFSTANGEEVRLTPMQRQLMELFFRSPSHTLTKQAICDALWPKKPDANDTLYTLIRRLKPVIEGQSQLKIESDRGYAYRLTDK